MKKFNYSTSAIEVVYFILHNADKAERLVCKKNFPNTWGGQNAYRKAIVRELLLMLNIPYTKELGHFVRDIVESQHMLLNLRYFIGLSLAEALWGYEAPDYKQGELIGFSLKEVKQGKRSEDKNIFWCY